MSLPVIFSVTEFYCTCIDHIPKLPTLIFYNESCHKYLMEHSTGTERHIKRRDEILGVMKRPHN